MASNSILETFSDNYTLFNMPYLFASAEAYHASMDDPDITGPQPVRDEAINTAPREMVSAL